MSSIQVIAGNISEHQEAVELHHRFMPRMVGDVEWEFSHLEAFVMKVPININPSSTINIDVIILFANYCFTRNIEDGEHPPAELIFDNGIERRVLDPERYELSKIHLRSIIQSLPNAAIFYADIRQPNFVTFELKESKDSAKLKRYAVYLFAEKDRVRKRRVLLRIQSAYIPTEWTRRQEQAHKISFRNLIKRAYQVK